MIWTKDDSELVFLEKTLPKGASRLLRRCNAINDAGEILVDNFGLLIPTAP